MKFFLISFPEWERERMREWRSRLKTQNGFRSNISVLPDLANCEKTVIENRYLQIPLLRRKS